MPPSGAPFAPVADQAASGAGGADDPRFDRPEPKVWSSEELHAAANAVLHGPLLPELCVVFGGYMPVWKASEKVHPVLRE